MDLYFERELVSDERKFKFAKLKLVRQAIIYRDDVERMIRQRRDIPITTWGDMKLKLREKYLPRSYEPSSYALRCFDPSSYKPRSMTYRSDTISYDPKEPITPRYQYSASQVSLSWLEPIRISAPYQK